MAGARANIGLKSGRYCFEAFEKRETALESMDSNLFMKFDTI